ncbi:hypothetical protein PTI98_010962 [Pleurotus ostreatus]|uniref:Uncharacterized protein n=1 Tax=Pleurotus cornucopiae TaxID=5321 RepID=A0ACB7JDN6_PLECO|nr:hypothetical protein CCMSSC00406_0000918 [Pleurotus cornucopiae]KAJ8691379.1 hypothetical protein PTI98_010962 [Pleurotus ostreatus]
MRLGHFCVGALSSFIAFGDVVNAIKLTMHGRRHPTSSDGVLLGRRGNVSPLTNKGDVSYYTNITLGGAEFTVLIDTGSTDLWVAGKVPESQDTGKASGVTYAIGEVKGPIKKAHLDFAGHTVLNQAYLEITPGDEPAGTGLIGLGPNSGSNIFRTLNSSDGHAVLDRIFLQNTSTPNFMTVLLGRSEDPVDTFPGDLTIGEILPGFENITSQPKLTVTDVPIWEVGDQHFQVLLDADGIIGPTGQPVKVKTAVDETKNKKQVTAIVDTGFSLSQVPRAVADAFYGDIPGAQFANVSGIGRTWIVPCTEEVNITFKFAGQSYRIHPLDAALEPSLIGIDSIRNAQGQDCCIGTFQPILFNLGKSPNFDMILGMSFLRNAYTLIDFGDFLAESKGKGDPYIQFLSTTGLSDGHSEFVRVRLGGNDTTTDRTLASSHNNNTASSGSKRTLYYILAGVLIGLAFLIVVGFLIFNKVRQARNRKTAYHSLGDQTNAPTNAAGMQQYYNPNTQYDPYQQSQYQAPNPQYNQQPPQYSQGPPPNQYSNPWDHRY